LKALLDKPAFAFKFPTLTEYQNYLSAGQMRIVLCYPVDERHVTQIRQAAPGADVVDVSQERLPVELFQADVFCGHPKVPIDWEGVVREKRLKWIQSSAAGLDHLLVPVVVESGIVVTSASGVLADQVAEHTLALITAWTRGLPRFWEAQTAREFIRRPTRDLHHANVAILGVGGIGRRIAEVLSVFKTHILAVDLFPKEKPEHVEALVHADQMEEVLGAAEIVILSLPLTEKTRGIINRRTLGVMRPGSLLANVARGPLVVEKDLVEALRSGHLGGAVLDVTEREPLPPDSPLWSMPQVIITPHVAGQSRWRSDRMTDFFCENLRRYLAGAPVLNLVDKRLGFPVRL
jgi:D-3-phosphoglycerate dehydrogenase